MFYNKIVLHSNNCCNCIVFKKRITTNYKETKEATSGKFGWKFEANNLGVCINQLLASLNLQVLDLHFNSYRRETAPWIRKWENKNSNEILVATRFFSKGFSREKRGKKKKQVEDPHSLLSILFISQYSPFSYPSTTDGFLTTWNFLVRVLNMKVLHVNTLSSTENYSYSF